MSSPVLDAQAPLIEAQAICFNTKQRNILSKVNLKVRPGEVVTLIGPNGAGKTSLVKILLGLQKPSDGRVNRPSNLVIGYMPQKLHLDNSLPLSVSRFLQLGQSRSLDRSTVLATLERVRASKLIDQPLANLSGGETQRVLLARALLRKPQLLVLDEPAQGVDVSGQTELYRLIDQIRQELNCGVLMVSHDLHLVMANTDTVVCLNQHVCCHGHPESVSEHPEYLALFGEQDSSDLAIYTHHHDHDHNLHGDVVTDSPCNHNH